MRRVLVRVLAVFVTCLAVTGVLAQQQQQDPRVITLSPVLVIDEDRLFFGSLFGRRVTQALGAAQRQLEADDARIAAELSAEEDALTEARATMDPQEFRKSADAFDAKVVRLRAEIEERSRALSGRLATERRQFRSQIAPVLEQIVRERRASVIIEIDQVFASIDQVDITDLAIARINQVLGDGARLGAPDTQTLPVAPDGVTQPDQTDNP